MCLDTMQGQCIQGQALAYKLLACRCCMFHVVRLVTYNTCTPPYMSDFPHLLYRTYPLAIITNGPGKGARNRKRQDK